MSFIIGYDLDGCAYEFERTARYLLRTRKGYSKDGPLGEFSRNWDWIENNVLPGDWDWLWSEGLKQGLFRHGHVVTGAIEAAEQLAAIGDIIVITSRPKQAVKDTMAWLDLHFDRVNLAGLNILSHDQKKSQVRPQPDVYIDDGGHNLDEIVRNTPDHVRAILFDRPWNQDFPDFANDGFPIKGLDNRWRRARGWDEAVELVRTAKEGAW